MGILFYAASVPEVGAGGPTVLHFIPPVKLGGDHEAAAKAFAQGNHGFG